MLTVDALHPSGFTVHLQVAIEQLDATIEQLTTHGFRPTSSGGDGWQRTPEGLPLCPKHQVPMRLREKQRDSWYSHQLADPSTGELLYCRGYASPNSPGWPL